MESQQPLTGPEAPRLLGEETRAVELVNVFDKMKAVKAFIFDMDGVLTDNNLLVTEAGELLRSMNVRDGQALKWARQAGYPVAIITGGKSQGAVKRLANLGIEDVYSGIEEKYAVFLQLLEKHQLLASEICFMGDDLPDLPILRKVGLACCPNDAVPELLEVCDYVSARPGGSACVRDVIEKVMKLQDKWPKY